MIVGPNVWLAIGVRSLGLLLAGLASFACSPDVGEWPEGRPKISDVEFLKSSSTQDNTLEFQLFFTDSDANLPGGRLVVWVNDEARPPIELTDLYDRQEPPLSHAATSGTLKFAVMFDATTSGAGDKIELDFEVTDGNGQVSNLLTLNLVAIVGG